MAEGLVGIVGHRSDMFSWDGDDNQATLLLLVMLELECCYWILKVGMTMML
jgi:hypothetical protein